MSNLHMQTVIYKSKKLIHFEINELRKIQKTTSFKNVVIECLEHLFKFYNINNLNIINDLYEIEEDYAKKINNIEKPYYNNNADFPVFNDIEILFNQYSFLIEFVEDGIYYDCFYHKSIDYNGYELENIFYTKLVSKYIQELDLPKNYFYSLLNEKKHTRLKLEKKIRDSESFNAFSCYQENKDFLKIYNLNNDKKNKNLDDFIFSKSNNNNNNNNKNKQINFEELFGEKFNQRKKEKNSVEYKGHVLAQYKWQLAINILSKYGNCDPYSRQNCKFNSFPLYGFSELIQTHSFSSETFDFELIDNTKLIHILSKIEVIFTYFDELSLSGELVGCGHSFFRKTNQSFKDKSGVIIKENEYYQMPFFNNLSIKVGKKATWDISYNEKLRKLINILNIEGVVLFFDKKNKPIIQFRCQGFSYS